MESVMNRASGAVKPVAKQISDPFTQHGALQVVVLFELSDGQTISIYFHNPDTTPKKIAATDELVSWKWLLNKKDVTILVAPEQGKELNAREVARRIMKAAEKNSAAFVRNNAKRAERLQAIEAMKTEIVELETECKDLERQIDEARLAAMEPEPVVEPTPEPLTQGPLPWDNQTRDDESNARWFGTKVKQDDGARPAVCRQRLEMGRRWASPADAEQRQGDRTHPRRLRFCLEVHRRRLRHRGSGTGRQQPWARADRRA
jgi:hypothetical protein